MKRTEQAEWDRMNAKAAEKSGNGRPVVTTGNTGRGRK